MTTDTTSGRTPLRHSIERQGTHLLWMGPIDRVTPYFKSGGKRHAVRRLVLAKALDRRLVGQVTATCREQRCVAPSHLLDEIGRRDAAIQAARARAAERRRLLELVEDEPRSRSGTRYTRGHVTAGAVPQDIADAFSKLTLPLDEHLIWTGQADHDATPTLTLRKARYSALQIGWVLHYGTDPVGKVLRSCGEPLCVAGRCLSDHAMRQQEQVLRATLLGIDLAGECERGHDRREHSSVAMSGKVECRRCSTLRRRHRRTAEQQAVAA